MEAYFDQATATGGPLEGYTVEIDNQDSKYDPATAIPLFNGMKDDVAMFSMLLGAPIIDALLPTMKEDGLIGVPAGIVPKFLYDENLVPTFPLLNSYHAAAVDYAANELDLADSTFCSLIVEDTFGDAIQEAYDFAVDDLSLTTGDPVRYASGNEDFTAQVSSLKDQGCETVVVGGVGMVVQQFAIKAVQLDYNPQVLTSNTAYNITMATGPGADWIAEHVLFAVTGTSWDGDEAPGQPEMVAALDGLGVEIVPAANAYQTGWINASVTTQILSKALESGDMSRENLMEIASTQLGVVDDMGMSGGSFDYGSSIEERTPPSGMSFFGVDAAVPTGLALVDYGYESSVVADYIGQLQ
jgi:ABC-type branched-subunit amino acid transport system substrate-binding protein